MKKIYTKLFSMLLAGVLACTFMLPSKTIFAAGKMNDINVMVQEKVQQSKKSSSRRTEPEEWNRREITSYQFTTAQELVEYMLTGGIKYYTNKFNAPERMVKITVADPGTFMLSGTIEGTGKILLYNENKKYIRSISGDDEQGYYQLKVKAGDVFYARMPAGMEKGMLMTYVLKDDISTFKEGEMYVQSGKGTPTYHQFKVKKRCQATMGLATVEAKGGNITYYIQKNVKGKWIKIGKTNVVKSINGEERIYGLQKGTYRVVLKAGTSQGTIFSYSAMSVKKKVAFKKAAAQVIKKDDKKTNIYTTTEKASRWYKLLKNSKKSKLYFGSDASCGGFKFTVYQNGNKKPLKTLKVYGDKTKSYKLPEQSGTYYIKVSKLTKQTNGTYGISYY